MRVFPGSKSGKEPTCQCRRHKRHGFDPWVGKVLRKRACQPTPVFLSRESHRQRSLAGYSPWRHKESNMTERLRKAQQQEGVHFQVTESNRLTINYNYFFQEDLCLYYIHISPLASCHLSF